MYHALRGPNAIAQRGRPAVARGHAARAPSPDRSAARAGDRRRRDHAGRRGRRGPVAARLAIRARATATASPTSRPTCPAMIAHKRRILAELGGETAAPPHRRDRRARRHRPDLDRRDLRDARSRRAAPRSSPRAWSTTSSATPCSAMWRRFAARSRRFPRGALPLRPDAARRQPRPAHHRVLVAALGVRARPVHIALRDRRASRGRARVAPAWPACCSIRATSRSSSPISRPPARPRADHRSGREPRTGLELNAGVRARDFRTGQITIAVTGRDTHSLLADRSVRRQYLCPAAGSSSCISSQIIEIQEVMLTEWSCHSAVPQNLRTMETPAHQSRMTSCLNEKFVQIQSSHSRWNSYYKLRIMRIRRVRKLAVFTFHRS